MPPEQLIMFAIVAGTASAVVGFILGDRLSVTWRMAIPLVAFAVLSIGTYLTIEGQDAIDAARWRRTHETGE